MITDVAAAEVVALLAAGAVAGVLGAAVLCLVLYVLLGRATPRPRHRRPDSPADLADQVAASRAATATAAQVGAAAAELVHGGRHFRPEPTRVGRVDDAP